MDRSSVGTGVRDVLPGTALRNEIPWPHFGLWSSGMVGGPQ